MKGLILVTALALLAGCSAGVVASSERSVVVYANSAGTAQPIADAHCKKNGRFAEFSGQPMDFQFAYRCVN